MPVRSDHQCWDAIKAEYMQGKIYCRGHSHLWYSHECFNVVIEYKVCKVVSLIWHQWIFSCHKHKNMLFLVGRMKIWFSTRIVLENSFACLSVQFEYPHRKSKASNLCILAIKVERSPCLHYKRSAMWHMSTWKYTNRCRNRAIPTPADNQSLLSSSSICR